MRGQKGITLVALIITIVVLLILTTVAITSISSTELIPKANQAVNNYAKAQEAEDGTLKEYVQWIKDNEPKS